MKEQVLLVAGFQQASWQQIDRIADDRLMAVAYRRAREMATLDFFDHVDLDGSWPNMKVREAGYVLPDDWSDDSNQVESIAAGHLTAEDALAALVESDRHHEHVTGQGFWSDHYYFGAGYCYSDASMFKHYYVVITAPEEIRRASAHTVYLPKVEKWIINP